MLCRRVEALKKTTGPFVFGSNGWEITFRINRFQRWLLVKCAQRCPIAFFNLDGTKPFNLLDPAQLFQRRKLAVVNLLDAIANRLLGDANVLDKFLEATRLNRGCLI